MLTVCFVAQLPLNYLSFIAKLFTVSCLETKCKIIRFQDAVTRGGVDAEAADARISRRARGPGGRTRSFTQKRG
jgi:hypothetical protein